MSKLIKLAAVSDITNGKMKEYKVEDKRITIANINGSFHAFSALCTHAECSLAGGFLDGKAVTCYCHGAQFDLQTGKVLAPPATKPLVIYKVKIEKEDIFVEI